jgi:hypothetical protein
MTNTRNSTPAATRANVIAALVANGFTLHADSDLSVRDHGTIIAIRPNTDFARDWVNTNVHYESHNLMGGWIHGDHRPMRDLIDGAMADGLTVSM